jgi:hypothetical protein
MRRGESDSEWYQKSTGSSVKLAERLGALQSAIEDKKRKAYEWPAVQKGQSSQQARRQALQSISTAKAGNLFQETMQATRPFDASLLSRFKAVAITDCGSENIPPQGEPLVRAHALTSGDVVLDEEKRKIDWEWSNERKTMGSATARLMAGNELSRSSRMLRTWCKYDDLIDKALDFASADGRRGRWKTGVKAWFAFCEDVMGVPANRPMDPMTTSLWEKLEDEWLVMRFVCALVQERGITPQSAAVYFSCVQGWHAREHGVKLAGGMKLERLPQMLKGLRRLVGDVPKKVRRGIAPQMLRRAMDLLLDPSNPTHANLRAALAVALQGLLRASEFTDQSHKPTRETLMRCDVSELTSLRMVIMMSPCKNMHHLGGKTCPLVIGAGGAHVCAVTELANLLRVDPTPDGQAKVTPLFRDPSTGRPLQYQQINQLVKRLMAAVGEPEEQFSAHSLRIGGATALFAAGANETVIRTMGRWSSDMHRLYVRACFEQCCAWTVAAGSAQVSDLAGEFDEGDDCYDY